jgi:small subunit ribosomal protein S4e
MPTRKEGVGSFYRVAHPGVRSTPLRIVDAHMLLPSPRATFGFLFLFADVITIEKSGDLFRLLYDTKGRFVLHSITEAESKYKLGRVVKAGTTARNIPYIVTHDARTIRYPDPLIKVNDTVKIDLATGKVIDFVKFEIGNTAMVTKGRNTGRVGTIVNREKHPGSFDIVHVKDSEGTVFATRLANTFVIGKGEDKSNALVSLPRGKGVKRNIFQERDARARK